MFFYLLILTTPVTILLALSSSREFALQVGLHERITLANYLELVNIILFNVALPLINRTYLNFGDTQVALLIF